MAKSQQRKALAWTEPKELQLINFYKQNRCLWDEQDPQYGNEDEQEQSVRRLARQLGSNFTGDAIRAKFRQLHQEYQRTRQHGLRRKSSLDDSHSERCREALSFLDGLDVSTKKKNGKKRKSSEQQTIQGVNGETSSILGRGSGAKSSNWSQTNNLPKSVRAQQNQNDLLTKNRRNKATANSSPLDKCPIGPLDGTKSARFSGISTFARLPQLAEVDRCDVAIVGIPFDAGTSYRPGARFGPAAIRAGSRLLRFYHPELQVAPFEHMQVADCGDIASNPFKIDEALAQITSAATALVSSGAIPIALGGDHTIALPMLRVVSALHGPVALLHFDAHLDTWDTYFGAPHTHGTVFLRASEEGLLDPAHLTHVGIRGSLYSANDLPADAKLGFGVISTMDVAELGVKTTTERIRQRVGDAPLYISIDIDVLDPAHAPGTGTPEVGGLTSRELLGILRGLNGCRIVGADVVEVAPAYDHAEVTAIAAAQVVYELVSLLAVQYNADRKS